MKETPQDIQKRAVANIPKWKLRLESSSFIDRYIQGATDERKLWMEFIDVWLPKQDLIAYSQELKWKRPEHAEKLTLADLFQLFLTTKTNQNERNTSNI